MRRQVRSPFLLTAIAIGLFLAAVWYARVSPGRESLTAAKAFAQTGCGSAASMFRKHRSGAWLTISGNVIRLLGDSNGRFKHQRFILGCSDGLTLLIVNDVSIGQRVPLVRSHKLAVRGQYEWDRQGGLVHFTHHADNGAAGWILYGGQVYQ